MKQPGKRKANLDNYSCTGRFLGFTAAPKNIKFIDDISGQIKTGTHVIFDEAHMATPAEKAPLAAQDLQRLGYHRNKSWVTEEYNKDLSNNKQILMVQKLSATAQPPLQGSKQLAGYDLFSDSSGITIEPGEIQLVPTGVSFKCPEGTYGRIAPRSGLTIKNKLTTLAGVIDPDYMGEIIIVLYNFGENKQTGTQGQRIAQVIFENILNPTIQIVDKLTTFR